MVARHPHTKIRLPVIAQTLGFIVAVTLFGCASRLPEPIAAQSQPDRQPAVAEAAAEGGPASMPAYVEAWLRQDPARPVLALLLPLTSPFSATAEAVRDGFLAHHFAAGGDGEVRVYDVGDSPDWLLSAYQRALDDGAGMIAGPLQKDSVARLAAMAPPVPVLALNYLDAGTYSPFNFHQFGLAPEDEARAAADDAGSRGLRRAVALVPEGDWGARVLAAFEQQLQRWGGQVVNAARYRQGVSDQKANIAQLMGVAASEDRHRTLTSVLGVRTEFEARRRADIDHVFLAARPADARVLLPQFRFYRASGLPHYATSLVYEGRTDAELNGLRFCDMPFVLDAHGQWARERMQTIGLRAAASQPRLYAFGHDAYALAVALQRGTLRVGDSFAGATGVLEWSASSTLSRRLECVEIRTEGLVPARTPAL